MKHVYQIDIGVYQIDYGKYAYVVKAKSIKEAIKIADCYFYSRGKVLFLERRRYGSNRN